MPSGQVFIQTRPNCMHCPCPAPAPKQKRWHATRVHGHGTNPCARTRCAAVLPHTGWPPSGRSASACSSAQQSAATSHQAVARSISQRPTATPSRRAVRVRVTRHWIDLHVLAPRFLGKATPLPPTLRVPFPSRGRGEKNMGDLTSPRSHTSACVRVVKCMY